jgi:hypothetical protein
MRRDVRRCFCVVVSGVPAGRGLRFEARVAGFGLPRRTVAVGFSTAAGWFAQCRKAQSGAARAECTIDENSAQMAGPVRADPSVAPSLASTAAAIWPAGRLPTTAKTG